MRWISYPILCVLIMAMGCNKEKRIPRNVLQPEEMKQVMWDVFLAEAWANQIVARDSTVVLSDQLKELTQNVFQVNKTSEKEFFESYKWYINHPEVFNVLLDSLQKVKSDDVNRPEITPVPLEEDENGNAKMKRSLLITRDDLKAFP